MYTNKNIWRITWPIAVEQGMNSVIGIISTMMVSNAGQAAISAVGLVEALNIFVIQLFTYITTGSTVVISQLTGKGEYERVKKSASQSLVLVVMSALIIAVALIIARRPLFHLLFGHVETAVMTNGIIYLTASALSYPLFAVYSTAAGILRGSGDTKTPMVVSFCVNVVYVITITTVIFGFNGGIYGAVAGLLAARLSGAVVMLIMLARRYGAEIIINPHLLRPQWEIVRPILAIGIPSGMDSAIFNGGKMIVQTYLAGMGTASIAANSIANSFFGIMSIPGNAFAISIMTITGQAWGAGNVELIRKKMMKMVWLSSAILALTTAFILGTLHILLPLYNPTPEAGTIVLKLVYALAVMLPLVWSTAFVLPSGMRATGDVNYIMIVSIISMWISRVAVGWVLGVYLGIGVLGIWIAMGTDWVVRSIFFIWRFYSGGWYRKKRAEARIADE